MSQSRKKKTAKETAEQANNPNPQAGNQGGRRAGIVIAIVVVLIMAGIIGFFVDQQYLAPFRRPVITVDDTTVRMDYFLSRLEVSGADPLNMLRQITQEQVMKLAAPQYGIEITDDDIDEALRKTFQGESETISENEFNEWYRQLINERGLSEAEFREVISIGILASHLQAYQAERMPTIANHRHIYIISVETMEEALEARARWEAGEDFSDLAKELSLDEETREKGGEFGWFPKGGVLQPQLEYEAFNLSTGNVSEPVAIMGEEMSPENEPVPTIIGYYLVYVPEEAVREIEEGALRVIQSHAIDVWYAGERDKYDIQYHGMRNGFDSETYAWINWQLAKRKPSGSAQTP